jgi:hypothetical protein
MQELAPLGQAFGPTKHRLSSLDFDAELEYEETAAGILVPIR